MNLLYKYSDKIDVKNFIGLNELVANSFKKIKEFEYVYCIMKHESKVICKFIYTEKSEYNEKTSNIMVNYFDSKYIIFKYYNIEIDVCNRCGDDYIDCNCYLQPDNAKLTVDFTDSNKIIDFGIFHMCCIEIEYYVYS